jgi:tetratricopeptide (TPR) repeat protein
MGILNDLIKSGRELYQETREIFQEGREIIEEGRRTIDDFVKETQRLEEMVRKEQEPIKRQETREPQESPKLHQPAQREVIGRKKTPKPKQEKPNYKPLIDIDLDAKVALEQGNLGLVYDLVSKLDQKQNYHHEILATIAYSFNDQATATKHYKLANKVMSTENKFAKAVCIYREFGTDFGDVRKPLVGLTKKSYQANLTLGTMLFNKGDYRRAQGYFIKASRLKYTPKAHTLISKCEENFYNARPSEDNVLPIAQIKISQEKAADIVTRIYAVKEIEFKCQKPQN